MGFRNLQERLKKTSCIYPHQGITKKRKYLAKTFPLGTFGKFFILVEFEVHTPFDVGLYKTKHCIQDNPINPLVSFTKTFLCLSMKNPRCIFQETIHQDSYNLILQLYVP